MRYRSLFDMMVDAVIASLAVSGQDNIPVIVAETGWPSEMEAKAAGNYAEIYLNELVAHLRSGVGTPLRKEGVAETYIYELFDDEGVNNNAIVAVPVSADANQHWGIKYPSRTLKYNVEFSGLSMSHGNDLLVLCAALMILGWKMVNLKSDMSSIGFSIPMVVFIFILASAPIKSTATVSASISDSIAEVVPAANTLATAVSPSSELSPHQSSATYSAATSNSTFINSKLVGVTYNPRAEGVPSPERVAECLVNLKIKSVRLMDPTVEDVHAFAVNNISVVLALPNTFVVEFGHGGGRGVNACNSWLNKTILSLLVELRAWVRVIGVGSDSSLYPYYSVLVVPAMENLYVSLSKANVSFIRISTSLSTHKILNSFSPPSLARFISLEIDSFFRSLLKFLNRTDSLFLINLYPHMLLTTWQSTVGFAVFGKDELYYLEDSETRIRYTNIYDVLVDSVFQSLRKERNGRSSFDGS